MLHVDAGDAEEASVRLSNLTKGAAMHRPLRGRPRGRMLVAGPETIDPARDYVVAGTDRELEPHGGLVDPAWQLQVRYDFPTIVREAVEG